VQTTSPTVFVVDDDLAVRDSLQTLLKTVCIDSETYSTADEFFSKYDATRPGCLILDVRMPGLSGPELQKKLKSQGVFIPTIVISGHGDIRVAVECVQAGAIDFVEKPLRDHRILELAQRGIAQDIVYREDHAKRQSVKVRLSTLSKREREVFDAVASGKAIKVIAADLGISHKTVESHRTNIMRKLDAQGVADLIRMSSVV